MWIWREDRENTAGGAFDRGDRSVGGWHVDAYGAWNWTDGPAHPVAPAQPAGPAHPAGGALALLPAPLDPWAGARPDAYAEGRSEGWSDPRTDETPIFDAVSDDHSRRSHLHPVDGAAWAAIPEPHPGSGPIPVQDGAPRSGRLAPVPTVPAPSAARDDLTGTSPEDELRRRAERRRRPRAETPERDGAGRHAMRDEAPRIGRHALGG